MTMYEKLTVFVKDDDGDLLEFNFKNATYMFDSNYTTILGKKKDITFKTSNVERITGEGKFEE